MKRLLASTTLIMLIATAFISGYFRCNTLPVYADNIPSGYSPAGYNDQVDAFKAYCKSRNVFIEGSIADAVTQVTSKVYQDCITALGLDINELQNEIYKKTDGIGQQFYFKVSGISAMNRIFAVFLQNHNLEVGDTADQQDNILKSGKAFIDADHNFCWIYTIKNNNTFLVTGSRYVYGIKQFYNLFGPNAHIFNLTDTVSESVALTKSGKYIYFQGANGTNYEVGYNETFRNENGQFIIAYKESTPNSLYFGIDRGWGENQIIIRKTFTPDQNSVQNNVIVFITTNNTTINNNNYEGDTYINNEGDVITYNDPVYNPYPDGGGTITPPSTGNGGSGSGGTLTLPDVDLDLPEIDWSIGDLSDKFPFSIPFDLIAFFTVLNAQPETPELQGEIDLGIIDWEIDWSLEDFDNLAKILRNLEFIGFCIGLIIITRSLIKG